MTEENPPQETSTTTTTTPTNNTNTTTTNTTATTIDKSNNKAKIHLRYDSSYVRRKGGILKIVEILFSLLGYISIQCTELASISIAQWFSIVSMLGVWIPAILLPCYLFHFVGKFHKIPWIQFELFYCSVLAVFFLIASCMASPIEDPAFYAAAFFGFFAMVIYGLDACTKYGALTSGEPAQAERKIDKDTVDILFEA